MVASDELSISILLMLLVQLVLPQCPHIMKPLSPDVLHMHFGPHFLQLFDISLSKESRAGVFREWIVTFPTSVQRIQYSIQLFHIQLHFTERWWLYHHLFTGSHWLVFWCLKWFLQDIKFLFWFRLSIVNDMIDSTIIKSNESASVSNLNKIYRNIRTDWENFQLQYYLIKLSTFTHTKRAQKCATLARTIICSYRV